jgi:hypothetical protein
MIGRYPWLPWALLNLAGIFLIALPDSDKRVFSISRTHGPALADLAGAILLTAGWVLLNAWTWKHRRALGSVPTGWKICLMVCVLAGTGLIAWSVSQDRGNWWLLGALVVAAVQAAAAVLAGRARRVCRTR